MDAHQGLTIFNSAFWHKIANLLAPKCLCVKTFAVFLFFCHKISRKFSSTFWHRLCVCASCDTPMMMTTMMMMLMMMMMMMKGVVSVSFLIRFYEVWLIIGRRSWIFFPWTEPRAHCTTHIWGRWWWLTIRGCPHIMSARSGGYQVNLRLTYGDHPRKI